MFRGIGPKAGRLITELAHLQDKAWYAERKADIDEHVYAPLRELFEEAKPAIARFYRGQPVNLKVFRIHRDVRFSNDKSPFKDHASAVIMVSSSAAASEVAGTAAGRGRAAAVAGRLALTSLGIFSFRFATPHSCR